MSETILFQRLRAAPFLAGVAEDDLRRLVPAVQAGDYPPQAELFRQGQKLAQVFLLEEGEVALEVHAPRHGAQRVHTVGAGELLGWSPLLGGGPMTATARAVTAVRVLALDAGHILTLCEQHPALGLALMRRIAEALAERLAATRLHMVELCHPEAGALASAVAEGAD
jgi:CRP-like cAMP-binding protein